MHHVFVHCLNATNARKCVRLPVLQYKICAVCSCLKLEGEKIHCVAFIHTAGHTTTQIGTPYSKCNTDRRISSFALKWVCAVIFTSIPPLRVRLGEDQGLLRVARLVNRKGKNCGQCRTKKDHMESNPHACGIRSYPVPTEPGPLFRNFGSCLSACPPSITLGVFVFLRFLIHFDIR